MLTVVHRHENQGHAEVYIFASGTWAVRKSSRDNIFWSLPHLVCLMILILQFCNIWNVFVRSSCPMIVPIASLCMLPSPNDPFQYSSPPRSRQKERSLSDKISRCDTLTRNQSRQLHTINHGSSCSLTAWNTKLFHLSHGGSYQQRDQLIPFPNPSLHLSHCNGM